MPKETEAEEKLRLSNIVKERITAMTVIKRACPNRYKTLQDDLLNAFLKGKDNYPETVSEALHLLNNYKCDDSTSSSITRSNGESERSANVKFIQTSVSDIKIKYLKGTNGSFWLEDICRRCNMYGHYQSKCPIAVNDRGTIMQIRQSTEGNNNEAVDSTSDGSQLPSQSNTSDEQVTQEVSHQCEIGLNQSNIDAYVYPNCTDVQVYWCANVLSTLKYGVKGHKIVLFRVLFVKSMVNRVWCFQLVVFIAN